MYFLFYFTRPCRWVGCQAYRVGCTGTGFPLYLAYHTRACLQCKCGSSCVPRRVSRVMYEGYHLLRLHSRPLKWARASSGLALCYRCLAFSGVQTVAFSYGMIYVVPGIRDISYIISRVYLRFVRRLATTNCCRVGWGSGIPFALFLTCSTCVRERDSLRPFPHMQHLCA